VGSTTAIEAKCITAELSGGCRCEDVFFLQGAAASQYRRIHLTGEIESIGPKAS
jgi:hypothetical protein